MWQSCILHVWTKNLFQHRTPLKLLENVFWSDFCPHIQEVCTNFETWQWQYHAVGLLLQQNRHPPPPLPLRILFSVELYEVYITNSKVIFLVKLVKLWIFFFLQRVWRLFGSTVVQSAIHLHIELASYS